MIDFEADYILTAAMHAAIAEVVLRGIRTGQAIQRGVSPDELNAMPQIFDALDAYYNTRSARERLRAPR